MSKRTPWTSAEAADFERWHESVIARYPAEVAKELRRARLKMLSSVRVLPRGMSA